MEGEWRCFHSHPRSGEHLIVAQRSLFLDGDLNVTFDDHPINVTARDSLAIIDVTSLRRAWKMTRAVSPSGIVEWTDNVRVVLLTVGLTLQISVSGAIILRLGAGIRTSALTKLVGLHAVEVRWWQLMRCLLRHP